MSNLSSSPRGLPLLNTPENGFTLTQEYKNFVSSLPSQEGWLGNPIYQYQGFWLPPKNLQGLLNCQKHFKSLDSDIILSSIPKSGTTWLKALAFALTNRTEYRNFFQDHPLLKTGPHSLVPFLELNLFAASQVPDLTKIPSPRLFATHLPYALLPETVRSSACKMVYVARNPKDTFVSLWHFINKLRGKEEGDVPLEKLFDMFCRGLTLNGPYWNHVLGYWRQSLENPKRVLFLKYEEMKEQPAKELKKLAEFLGCSFSEEEESDGIIHDILKLCSFDYLSNLNVTKTGVSPMGLKFDAFYRKGQVGDWKNYLTEEMEERLDKIAEEKWHRFGLEF